MRPTGRRRSEAHTDRGNAQEQEHWNPMNTFSCLPATFTTLFVIAASLLLGLA
jgi:hypothetical protein